MLQHRHHRLKLAPGVFYAKRDSQHLFLQPAAPDWMVVNENAAILLSRCAGSAMEEILGPGDEALWESAAALFTEALARQVLEDAEAGAVGQTLSEHHGLARLSLPSAAARTAPSSAALRIVHLKLTQRCNLRCVYCYTQSSAAASRAEEMLTGQDLDAIAAGVARLAAPVEYVLSGGEPLLHPHALDFAEQVKASGNQVHLLTNGTLIDERNAARIAALTDLVKISLDGSCERTHAATRGSGNFHRAERAVRLLEEHGARVAVAMTVTRENRGEIDVMVARHGPRLSLQPLFKAGRGSALQRSALSGMEYYRALTQTGGVAPMGNLPQRLASLRGYGVRRCSMAEREISISETGDVYPCQLLHGDSFRAGNIRRQPLEEIYAHSAVFRRLRSINVDTLGKCSRCAVRYLCGGACRARDLYETGSIETVGEFCAYERESLLNGLFDSVQMRAV